MNNIHPLEVIDMNKDQIKKVVLVYNGQWFTPPVGSPLRLRG